VEEREINHRGPEITEEGGSREIKHRERIDFF